MSNRTSSEIMESILSNFKEIEGDWERVKDRGSKAASRRIRKTLDHISKVKVELRKTMIEEERNR